jgi:membrane protease YdiL (CAAX protease family)
MSSPEQPIPTFPEPLLDVAPSQRDPAWNVWDVIMIAFLFLLAMLLSTAVVMGAAGALGLTELLEAKELAKNPVIAVAVQLLAYLLTFAFARFYISAKSRQNFWIAVRWNLPELQRAASLILLGATMAVVIQFTSVLLPVPKDLPVEQYFRSPNTIWLMVSFGTLVAPLIEETFFRGLLFPALRRWAGEPESIIVMGILLCLVSLLPFAWVLLFYQQISRFGVALVVAGLLVMMGAAVTRSKPQLAERWGTGIAVAITALLFALMHQGQLARAWAPLLLLFIVGVVLTLVRLRLDSLAASWLVHTAYNGMLFMMLYVGTGGFRQLGVVVQFEF